MQNFKQIAVVPDAKQFVDMMLSKTQRKTPTVVRKGFKISRIREFYMRKVKFTQQNFHDRLSGIIEGFPKLDELHPFYSSLINVLYSRDHYKLALGQLNMARTRVDHIAKDYVAMLKHGDSLYRCKQLKRAALGRMCTLLKRLNASLGYLEQVRQHLARLPSIDPADRTLIITGYPNVGKSSFINKITNAHVEVQPYAFTTKSIFVGHTDFGYMRFQVIDTPGILDHPLDARNMIEMQAITALAHLQSVVLFFIDISEQCGYSIKQQCSLFHNIKPLFSNKPMLVIANKTDIRPLDSLDAEDRALIESIAKERHTQVIPMSNAAEFNIDVVKSTACEILVEHRVERKLQKKERVNDIANRLQFAMPVKRDNKPRPRSIPPSVIAERNGDVEMNTAPKRTDKDVELENGGPGIYNPDLKQQYLLDHDDWKLDQVPEIQDGHNIADFYDPDIESHLDALEREEAQIEKELEQAMDEEDVMDDELDPEQKDLVDQIRTKKKLIHNQSIINHSQNHPVLPRKYRAKKITDVAAQLESVGLDSSRLRARSRGRPTKRKASRSATPHGGAEEGDNDGDSKESKGARSRSRSKTREYAVKKEGFKNVRQKLEAHKAMMVSQRPIKLRAAKGEADRHVFDLKPKHLNTGKRGIGTNDRR